jgi:recombination protein RecR
LGQDKSFALELSETIKTTVEAFKPCSLCLMIAESDPCPICSSIERNRDLLCIVEHSADIQIIENMNEYHGLYFVLGQLLSPIDGFGPNEINSESLKARISELKPQEIILALNLLRKEKPRFTLSGKSSEIAESASPGSPPDYPLGEIWSIAVATPCVAHGPGALVYNWYVYRNHRSYSPDFGDFQQSRR